MLSDAQLSFILEQRTARLATADAGGQPLVVPICFAYRNGLFYSPLDLKPKKVPPKKLKRVRNIAENPKVSLLFDRYDEDWSRLAYIIVRGRAEIIEAGDEQRAAVAALRERYPQYREMAIENNPVIKITPERAISWNV